MRFALVNPRWSFDGSIYFGCREPHLPLELGYSKALLEQEGHEALMIDGLMDGLDVAAIRAHVDAFEPDFTVIATAPSYLFWRCAQPELRVPQELANALRGLGGRLVAIGPHGSTTPSSALKKLGVDVVVLGECEEILPKLSGDWETVPSICYSKEDEIVIQGGPHSCDMDALPALTWPDRVIGRHQHHHHRFDAQPAGPGAEMEVSRGCPYHCTFCAKDNFRNQYRKRPIETILDELDQLISQGIEYVYFIDEIFLPNRPLLEALVGRNIKFGVQTRVDLWSPQMLDLLGEAGCVSMEAGVESITEEGRSELDKKCRMSTFELADRLVHAKKSIAFVQANLIEMAADDSTAVEAFRQYLQKHGVWANKPVPLFPYPGSPEYTRKWGAADDRAWERAHEYYLNGFAEFSDIQEERPMPLVQLETAGTVRK
jgi:B12-binding domain/radical SAM domain protein of rhizo-twelve system